MTQDKSLNLLIALAALAFTAYSCLFVVDQRERAVLFQLGEIWRSNFTPGLHFKIPFMQSVKFFDGRTLTLENKTENFLTKEKKNLEVDFFVKWRIDNVRDYYRATRGSEQQASSLLASIINQGLRDQFGSRTIQEAVDSQRDLMMSELETAAAQKVKELGIKLIDVRIVSINLPREVSGSVYDRMRAERTRSAADLRAKGAEEAETIRANADRQVQIIVADAYRDAEKMRGEGDSKASQIYAQAYGADPAFYKFYRSMSAYRESFGKKNDVMVLEPKGEFFEAFKGH